MTQGLVEPIVEVHWVECCSYDEAKDYFSCVYIHERDGQAYYVGIVDNSVFGGSTREIGDRRRSPRYGVSYRHWIDGCLEYGARFFIGTPRLTSRYSIKNVEDQLIDHLRPVKNADIGYTAQFRIRHLGAVPICVERFCEVSPLWEIPLNG